MEKPNKQFSSMNNRKVELHLVMKLYINIW